MRLRPCPSAGRPATVAVLSLGAVLTMLDATVVNVGLATLRRDLGLSLARAQWIATAYLLALAFSVPLTGWAANRFGATRVWLGAFGGFLAASALCGIAWSAASLVAFRVLQGMAGGMVMPLGQAIVVRTVAPDRLGGVLGRLSVPLLLGPVLGPLLGGAIVAHASWHWLFLVNVPIGLPVLAVALLLLRRDRPTTREPLDVRGLALLGPGLVGLVYALTRLGARGSADLLGVVLLAAGAGLVAAFVLGARGRGTSALIEVGLFRRVEFRSAGVIAFLFGSLMFGGFFLLPLYYQLERGTSAATAGLLTAPQGLGSALALVIAGPLADRFGPGRVVPAGLVLAMAATAVFACAGTATPYWALALAQFVRGAGMSSVMTPAYAAAYRALEQAAVPRATGAINVLNRVGGSAGIALLAVVLAATPGPGGFGSAYWLLFALTAAALIPAAFLPRSGTRLPPAWPGRTAPAIDGTPGRG